MFAKKFSNEWLTPARLDTDYYNPDAIEVILKIKNRGKYETFGSSGNVWGFGAYELCNQIQESNAENSPGFIKIGDIKPPFVDVDLALGVSEKTHSILSAAHVKPGDLLVSIAGTIGAAAIVPETNRKLSANQAIVKYRAYQEHLDAYFVCAYSLSNAFKLITAREAGGAVQKNLYLYNFLTIPIPKPDHLAQKYIGDKVRQAERLRAWAKAQNGNLTEFESRIPLQKPAADERKYSKAELNYLTDNRLDAKFYERKHLALEAQFNEQFRSLGAITSGFKYGASVTADYVSQDHGITFIRGNAISKNNINAADIVYLHKRFLDDVSLCRVKTGEVLITRSGTVGVACDVFDEFNGAAYGSFVIKCQPRTEQVSPTYLAWFLNSWAGQQQFRRWENGAVQLNINIEELSSIMVWLAPNEYQIQITELIEAKRKSDRYSRNLTIAAKLLVEALIEGQLTEAQLIAAEQALQAGNDQLDRRILNRLKTDGIDGQGPALFADLDELYRLLAQAEGD